MAGQPGATRTFFLKAIYLVYTPFCIDPLFKNKFFLTQKYLIEGLSARQIAEGIFSSKMAVLDALARFDIPIREKHYHHVHPSQPRFGKKLRNSKLVDFKPEQKIIHVIEELHQRGFSLRKIAGFLNDMDANPKAKRKVWHPEMIRRVIESLEAKNN